jgi:release factor glutamine methyltransferase
VLSLSADDNWHACLATRTTVEKALAETATTTTTAAPQGGTGTGENSAPAPSSTVYLSSLSSDLSSGLRPGSVDILIFNPPYVPTESVPAISTSPHQQEQARSKPTFEESSHLLSLSYAGGRDGMEVTNRMLSQLPETLSPRGVAYVLFCRGNRPEEVKASIRAWDVERDDSSNGLLEEGGEEQGGDGSRKKKKWHAETVGSSGKTAGWEKLEIVRIWRE